MKIKLIELINAMESLMRLGELPMTAKDSFNYMRFLSKSEVEFKLYYEKRDSLIKKYGHSDNEVNYIIPKEKLYEYNNEMNELNNLELDLEFEKIKINIEKLELQKIELKANDMIRVQKFIDFIEIENKDDKENIEK